jgi:hypothetical protein
MYNNPNECLQGGGYWNVSQPLGGKAPECLQAPWSRDNHLGNSLGGYHSTYLWTIPNTPRQSCVLRVRYNITSSEILWNGNRKNNASPFIKQDQIISSQTSGYIHDIQYAINQNQYGRTFQDRSYVFSIKEAPKDIPEKSTIWNLNVRGKRGNIVEVFPSVEYDFVPQVLIVEANDYIHFQWTGSDYNPDRQPNSAEGGPSDPANANAYRCDRSNILQLSLSSSNLPRKLFDVNMFVFDNGTTDESFVNLLSHLDQPGLKSTDPNIMCLNHTALLAKNGQNTANAKLDNQNCMKLGGAPSPYFDAGLMKMKVTGRFAYMSTRNNNFSNRSQKGLIIVGGSKFANAMKLQSPLLISIIFILISLFFK